MTSLIWIASSVVYVGLGLITARACAIPVYRRQWRWNVENWSSRTAQLDAPGETKFKLFFIALLWPIAPLVYLPIAASRFVFRPIIATGERVDSLRNDAAEWDKLRKSSTANESERDMAKQLAELCRSQADEIERRIR